jgi:hypothetical protein
VNLTAPRLGDHLIADQQSQLDADAGEPDAAPACLGRGGDVVVARQLRLLHPGAVIDHRQGRGFGRGGETDGAGAGVQRIGDDLGDDGLLEGARVCIAQVLQQMQQVDARLAHDVGFRSA